MSSFIDCVTNFTDQISKIPGRANEDGGFEQLLQKRMRWSDCRLVDEDPADYYKVLHIQPAKPFAIDSKNSVATPDSIAHNKKIDRNAAIIQGGGIPPFPLYKKSGNKAKSDAKDISVTDKKDSHSAGNTKRKEKLIPVKKAVETDNAKDVHFKGSWWIQECVAVGNIFKNSAFLEISKIISGAIVVGQTVTGPGIAEDTKIRNFLHSGDGQGQLSTFFLTKAQSEGAEDILLNFKGTILRATGANVDAIAEGQTIDGEGIPTGTTILSNNLPEIGVLYEASSAQIQDDSNQNFKNAEIEMQSATGIDDEHKINDANTEQDDCSRKGTYVDFVGDGRRVKAVVVIPPTQDMIDTVRYHALSIPDDSEIQPPECPHEIDIHTNGKRSDGVIGGSVFVNKGQHMEERYDGNTRVVKSKRDGKGYRYDYHCRHGKRKYRCKECGGSAFCSHGKERHRCKDCGVLCAHNLDRRVCEICVNRKKEREMKRGKSIDIVDDDITDDEDDDYEFNDVSGRAKEYGTNLGANQNNLLETDADPTPGKDGHQPSANNCVIHPNTEGVQLQFDWDTYTWISPGSVTRKFDDQCATVPTNSGYELGNNDGNMSSSHSGQN